LQWWAADRAVVCKEARCQRQLQKHHRCNNRKGEPLKDTASRCCGGASAGTFRNPFFWRRFMNSIVYIVGLVVIVAAILAFLGFR